MRSQVCFVMHRDDEARFVAFLQQDECIQFIDGPRWKTKAPNPKRSIDGVGHYCMIWSPNDLEMLKSRYIPECGDFYCESEYATIQWLRSEASDLSLTNGRIAISTDYDLEGFPEAKANQVDARFNRLRRFIKKHYKNSVARWYNEDLPFNSGEAERSANPSLPDKSLWIGPAAMAWLKADESRRIAQNSTKLKAFIQSNSGMQ